MRPKFSLMILLVTALAAGGITFLQRHSGNPNPSPNLTPAPATAPPPAPVPQPTVAAAPLPPPALPVSAPPPTPAPVAAQPATPEQSEAAIQAEEDNLAVLQMNDDAESLSNILADLNSPDKEIRMAAIQAAEQFGSTNAIPALRAAAQNDQDLDEKITLLKAADFLGEVTFGSGQ